jgi:hypothetical protein
VAIVQRQPAGWLVWTCSRVLLLACLPRTDAEDPRTLFGDMLWQLHVSHCYISPASVVEAARSHLLLWWKLCQMHWCQANITFGVEISYSGIMGFVEVILYCTYSYLFLQGCGCHSAGVFTAN